jgi:uncharacterized membrane protein YphA (DoxX/SURF4 family)
MRFIGKLFFIIGILFLSFQFSFSHVGYVVPESEREKFAGSDLNFLFRALKDPFNVLLIFLTIVLVLFIYFLLKRNKLFMNYVDNIEKKAESYYELTSWMLRLGLGIAFIGAGIAKVLISPLLSISSPFPFLEILLGFLFLLGFLLTPAILISIILFLFALSKNFYLLGNLEVLASLIALLILSQPKPGLDDLLGVPSFLSLKSLKDFVPLILRIGIGGAMMFLAVYEKFLNPHLSEIVVHNYHLTSIIPVSPEMWVLSAGIIEFLVGLFLFLGFKTRLASAVAFVVLSLSFFYFGEEVYSHVTLFSVLSVLFVTGGGKISIDNTFKYF